MNNELLVSTINFNYEFGKRQQLYSEAISHFEQQSRPLSPATFLEIVEVAKKRIEEVQKLKEQVTKLEGIILPEKYKKIMASIENEEALSSMLLSDTTDFLQTQDPKYEESIFTGFEYEKECGMELAASIDNINYSMGIIVTSEVLNDKISLEDLMDISSSIEKDTPFFKQLEELISSFEKKQTQEKQNGQQPIQERVETQNLRPLPPRRTQEKVDFQPLMGDADKKEPTLNEKISQVHYRKDGNMVAEVQALTIEDRLAQISASLTTLNEKQKLSLRDMIQLQSLQEEKIELEAYSETLDKQKLSRSERKRNQKMENVTERLYANAERLEQSNSQTYNSKLFRFISARYQEQLGEQLRRLNQKRGLLQEQQRVSAVAKYNRKSGKITRKSRILGLVRGTKRFASEKIAELKALREQVVQEFASIKQDSGRFFSDMDLLQELQQKNGYLLDQNRSIQEHAMQNQQMRVA